MVTAANSINFTATFNGKQALSGISKLEKSFDHFRKVVMVVLAGKMVKQAAEFGKQMSLMSDRVGMSVSKLTALKGAFVSAGSGAKGFEKTINNISSGLLGLSRGNGEFAAKLGMMGLSPYGADGQLKKPDEVLYDIADWAKGQKDSGMMSEQDLMYYLMSELGFDEATAKMALGGSGSIKAEAERAKKEGRTLDKSSADKLFNLGNKMAEMWDTLYTSMQKVVVALEPYLTTIFEYGKKFFKLMGEHPKITAFVIALASIIPVLTALSGVFTLIGTLLPSAAAALVAFKVAIVGLTGALLYFISKKLVEAVTSAFLGKGEQAKNYEFMQKFMTNGQMDMSKLREGMTSKEFSADEQRKIRQWYEAINGTNINVEQAANRVDGKSLVQDNSQTTIHVQGNMDNEVYQTVKDEQENGRVIELMGV